MDQVRLTLDEPPAGVTLEQFSAGADGLTLVLRAEAAQAKPGLQGNLIVEAALEGNRETGPAYLPEAAFPFGFPTV